MLSHAVRHASEWSNPGTLGALRRARAGAGRVLPGRDPAHRRVQQRRHRRHAATAPGWARTCSCSSAADRPAPPAASRSPPSPLLFFVHLRRGPRRTATHRIPAGASTPGRSDRRSRSRCCPSRPSCQRRSLLAEITDLQHRRVLFEVGLRVRHRRAVHRDHRRSADRRAADPGRADVPGPARPDHPGVGARAAGTVIAATNYRKAGPSLARDSARTAAVSWSSASAGSAPPWPLELMRRGHRGARHRRPPQDRAGPGRPAHPRRARPTPPTSEALRQLSVHEFDRVVIGDRQRRRGQHPDRVARAANSACRNIWAKAISDAARPDPHQIGVHHVVRPEHDMGQRVAHLVARPDARLHRVRRRLRDGEDHPTRSDPRPTPRPTPPSAASTGSPSSPSNHPAGPSPTQQNTPS